MENVKEKFRLLAASKFQKEITRENRNEKIVKKTMAENFQNLHKSYYRKGQRILSRIREKSLCLDIS